LSSVDADDWSNPSRGQCGSTALTVHDLLDGDLLIAEVARSDGSRQGVHYWNRLPEGTEIDLTRHQTAVRVTSAVTPCGVRGSPSCTDIDRLFVPVTGCQFLEPGPLELTGRHRRHAAGRDRHERRGADAAVQSSFTPRRRP
jgi:hypothetical protein